MTVNGPLSPAQVRAARALLAWSQQELAKQARVAASTVADFERGQRTPVPNNAEAIRTTLERAGVTFMPGGAIMGPQLQETRAAKNGGGPMRWVDPTDLVQWADRRDAQDTMPELLTRLIRAAAGLAAKLRFPSAESVQLEGWDGTCEIECGTEHIPTGNSGWEITTQREGITGKASDDYKKRTINPLGLNPRDTTFVFATPRHWTQKGDWVARHRPEGKWAEVRAYDADDLVHWIELYPAVGHWLAVAMGKRPPGLRQLDEVWEEWSLSTQCPLSADLTLAGRDEEATHVLRWLRGGPSVLEVQAESPDEAVAFLHASMHQLPADYRLQYQVRCLVATTAEAARSLGDSLSPLIIVIDGAEPGVARRLAERGHHVYVAYGSNAGAPNNILRLSRPPRSEIKYALEKMGVDERRAEALSRDSARSLAILRRLIPSAQGRTPGWAEANPSRGLLAALLAGAWNEEFAGDKVALERIAGQEYDIIVEELAPWVGLLDSPIRKVGTTWKIASPRDAWFMLARHVTAVDFDRFAAVATDVLGSPDPRFEMEADERWLAATKAVQPGYSELLRGGLGETLILWSLFGDKAPSVTSPAARVDYIVRKLLDGADRKRWWSLSRDFQLLAEAAPSSFLAAVDDSLGEEDPATTVLFGADGSPFGQELISDLLWALELLAWSPLCLGRVATIIAKLASLDPGGRLSKRPTDSLRQIFLLWVPQTYATLEQRLRVLDQLLRVQPEIAWQLMLDIFPKGYDTSMPSPHARWRDFSVDQGEDATYAVIARGAQELTLRLLAHVGLDARRWSQLIEALPNFGPDRRLDIIQVLADATSRINDDEARAKIWTALREFLHHHREFPDAEWALSTTELEGLEKIYLTLEPLDPVKRHGWLFESKVNLPRPTSKNPEETQEFEKAWRTDEAEICRQRCNAVADLLNGSGTDAVFSLADAVQLPRLVGRAVGELSGHAAEKAAILERALKGSSRVDQDVADGVIVASYGRDGEPWAKALLETASSEKWGIEATFRILRSLPETMWTWEQVAAAGEQVEDLYWRERDVTQIQGNENDLAFALNKLIEVRRARDAVHLVGHPMGKQLPVELLTRLIIQAANEPWASADGQLFRHYVVQIFKRLDKLGNIPGVEMARLEWAFLSFFRFSDRQPVALHKALAAEPKFFVEVLSALYGGRKEAGTVEPPAAEADQTRAIATQAYELLRSWHRVPGTSDDGKIDAAALENWVKETRQLCARAGLARVGDQHIGQVLAAAPADQNGVWPIAAVRDVIEITRSRDLETGLIIGVHNGRGITWRGVFDGGVQERESAQHYRKCAEATALEWPRTSAVLDRLARNYEEEGRSNDDEAQRNEW